MDIETANPEMLAAWNGDEGVQWAHHGAHYEASMRAHGLRMLDAAAIRPNARVLDVGCGSGDTTLDAARRASTGTALGVDLSVPMLERARAGARDEGITNVVFEQADAQLYPFAEASVDVVISRFGSMFFSDPVAAFANIGRAMAPGGRMAIATWQPLDGNEWQRALIGALAMGRDIPSPPVGAPGPFGLADRRYVEDVMDQSGWREVHVEDLRESVNFGPDTDDAFAFVSDTGIARGLLRELDEGQQRAALDQLRAVLDAHDTGHGVLFDSSAWLVTGHRP